MQDVATWYQEDFNLKRNITDFNHLPTALLGESYHLTVWTTHTKKEIIVIKNYKDDVIKHKETWNIMPAAWRMWYQISNEKGVSPVTMSHTTISIPINGFKI